MSEKQTESEKSVIFSYEESKRKLAAARKTIVVSLFSIILIAVVAIWSSASSFLNEDMPAFTVSLNKAMKPVVLNHMDEATAALKRIYPAYTSAFEKMLDRDLPKIESAAVKELSGLEEYANKRWLDFDGAINKLAVDQEKLVADNLAQIIGEDKAVEISEMYTEALQREMYDFLLTHLVGHQDLVDDIRKNLQKIAKTETDVKPPVEMHQAIGTLLELTGVKMQSDEEI